MKTNVVPILTAKVTITVFNIIKGECSNRCSIRPILPRIRPTLSATWAIRAVASIPLKAAQDRRRTCLNKVVCRWVVKLAVVPVVKHRVAMENFNFIRFKLVTSRYTYIIQVWLLLLTLWLTTVVIISGISSLKAVLVTPSSGVRTYLPAQVCRRANNPPKGQILPGSIHTVTPVHPFI